MSKQLTVLNYSGLEAVSTSDIKEVLDGDVENLIDSFTWDGTPQGGAYWAMIYNRRKKMSKGDKNFLVFLCSLSKKYPNHDAQIYFSPSAEKFMGIDKATKKD